MITVKFKENQTLSFDGINIKEYKKGEPHQATSAHEARIFNSFVENGKADLVTGEKEVKATPSETKVTKPKSKKSK